MKTRKHPPLNFDLQEAVMKDMAEQLAKNIQEEIDFQILSDMLVSMGWHHMTFEPFREEKEAAELKEWFKTNCKGKVQSYGSNWLFENEKDMAWFILRWGDRADG